MATKKQSVEPSKLKVHRAAGVIDPQTSESDARPRPAGVPSVFDIRRFRAGMKVAGAVARIMERTFEGIDPALVRTSTFLVVQSVLVATLIDRLEKLSAEELIELSKRIDDSASRDTPRSSRGRSGGRKPGTLPPEFPEIVRSIYGVDINPAMKSNAPGEKTDT